MNSRTSRILLVIFVGLLGVVYFIKLESKSTPQLPVTLMPEVFSGVVSTQITRIEIENLQTGRKVRLIKVPGDWQATDEKGDNIAPDYRQIARILQKLPNLHYSRVMDSTDVNTFGLTKGGFFIVRFEASGLPYVLHIGDLSSDQNSAYVRRENDTKILQVSADQIYTLIVLVNPS